MLLLFCLLFFSCSPDYGIVTEKVYENIIEYEDPGGVWIDSFIQPGDTSGVDIVWVVDRSGSMIDNDEKLVSGIDAMMKALPIDLGWRIGIISTDEYESISNTNFPLVPGDTPEDAENIIDDLGIPYREAGFESLVSYMDYGSYSHTWMRYDASLLVIFVSDEEEQSVNFTPGEFVSWVRSKRSLVNLASIVLTEDSECEVYNMPGYNYMEATNTMGGVVIDICSDDWSGGVKDATHGLDPVEYIELSYFPVVDSIEVFINNSISSEWSYDKDSNVMTFTTIPLQGDLVEIGYNIAN